MGKQTFDRMKKNIATLLVAFFVLSITAAAVGATSFSFVAPGTTGSAFGSGADVVITGTGIYSGINYGIGTGIGGAANSVPLAVGGSITIPAGITGGIASSTTGSTGVGFGLSNGGSLSIASGTTGNLVITTTTSTSHT